MRSTTFTYFFVLVIAAALITSDGLLDRPLLSFAYGSIFHGNDESGNRSFGTDRPLAFVGDVMLARDVEQYMRRYGNGYPFGIFNDLPSYQYLIGNFEAAVPKQHVPTKANELRFSVPKERLSALAAAGFTHLSLANNHSYDFGGAGYLSSLQALRTAGVVPFGHPSELTDDTVTYLTYNQEVIALIGLHTLDGMPSPAALSELLEEANNASDLQIAYIHWGEEYVTTHSKQQARFARTLIDGGVDLVIGHHPHVVQDVEVYDGKLIFYSLGNFVFDQYFSDAVGDGLAIELASQDESYSLTVVPVTTKASRIRPRLLTGYERERILEKLAESSDSALRHDLRDGQLRLTKELAY